MARELPGIKLNPVQTFLGIHGKGEILATGILKEIESGPGKSIMGAKNEQGSKLLKFLSNFPSHIAKMLNYS